MIGRADYFSLGDWNAACSACGRKRKASTMVKNWQGQYRCPEHNDPRHPQDFVRGIPDNQAAPWVQPLLSAVGFSADPWVTEATEDTDMEPDYILTEDNQRIYLEDN